MTKCPNFKVLWLSSKFVGWSSGSRLVGWNSCWIFFGVIRKCGKKQQGQTVKLRFFWSSSWISGGCLSVLFFSLLGLKKIKCRLIMNDILGGSTKTIVVDHIVSLIFGLKRTVFDLSFSYCPMIQPSNAFTFSYGGNLLGTKNLPLCHPLKATKNLPQDPQKIDHISSSWIKQRRYCSKKIIVGAVNFLGYVRFARYLKKTTVSWYKNMIIRNSKKH